MENHSDPGSGGDLSRAGSADFEIDDWDDPWASSERVLSDAGLFLGVERQDTLDESLDIVARFANAQRSALPVVEQAAKKRGRPKKGEVRAPTSKAPKATARAYELFEEGPERDSFLLIYGHAYNLLQLEDAEARMAAMHFFYDVANEDRLTFQDTLDVVGGGAVVRGDVIRLRFMYEFWVRWFKPPVMGFEASPVPDFIEAKACLVGGIEAGILAGEIWYQPGINMLDAMAKTADICERVTSEIPSNERMRQAIEALIADGYMVSARPASDGSPTQDLWLTGTNPQLLEEEGRLTSRGTHDWTKFFGGSSSR